MRKKLMLLALILGVAISGCGRVSQGLGVNTNGLSTASNEANELATYIEPIKSADGEGALYLTEIATIPAIEL